MGCSAACSATPTGPAGSRRKRCGGSSKLRSKLEQWEKLCADLGEEPAAVALAWLLAQDGVTCPIIGPRTMEQLDGASLRALEIVLAPDTLTAIDAIFPGPGGTAPEAYAW